jgi:serine phosphatase RsbU (regulator of sigma subunit)
MAKTATEDTKAAAAETSAAPQVTANDVTLPDYFDLGKAGSIAGMKDATSFRDEVLMITSGDLSGHGANPGVSFKALIESADDEQNSSRALAQDTLKRVRQIFAERINSSTKNS